MSLEKAFLEVQKELKAVQKDAENPFFKSKYATYDAVVENVKPALNKYGLSFRHTSRWADNIYLVGSELVHASSGERSLPFEMPIKIGNPQETGSALSYAKRYTLAALVGLASDEDDDGNASSGGQEKEDPRNSLRHPYASPNRPMTGQATEKQVAFLKSEAKRRGWSDAELKTAAFVMGQVDELEKMTKASISELINTVKSDMTPADFLAKHNLPPVDENIPF